jgi:hypothetical protein
MCPLVTDDALVGVRRSPSGPTPAPAGGFPGTAAMDTLGGDQGSTRRAAAMARRLRELHTVTFPLPWEP